MAPLSRILTRSDSSLLPRLAAPYSISPMVMAVVNWLGAGTLPILRTNANGGSRFNRALSTSVSKQYKAQPKSGTGRSSAFSRAA